MRAREPGNEEFNKKLAKIYISYSYIKNDI